MERKEIMNLIKDGEGQCVEFKRNFEKGVIESLVAFSNSDGGKVFVGVSDSGDVVGIDVGRETVRIWINEIKNKTDPFLLPDFEVMDFDGKKVVVLDVKEFPLKPVSFKGKVFIRKNNSNQKCSVSEVSEIYLKTKRSSWDYYVDKEVSFEDLDKKKIRKVIGLIEKNTGRSLGGVNEFLRKYELTSDEGVSNAAVLLFSKKKRRETDIQIGLFGDEITIKKDKIIRGDLIGEVGEVMDFVKAYILKEFIITGDPAREERWQYPLDAIRELVVNAIVHRDYRGSHSQFKVFFDRLDFWNAGGLPYDLSVEDVMEGRRSEPRNKLIAEVFRDCGFIERYGSGVKRVREMLREYGLRDLSFVDETGGVRIRMFAERLGGEVGLGKDAGKDAGKELTDLQKSLLGEMRANNRVTLREFSESLGRDIRTIERNIARLRKDGLVRRVGGRREGVWEVVGR